MFTYQEKEYDLKYSNKRVEQIETVINKPLMGVLVSSNGMIDLRTLKTMIAYGTVDTESSAHISPSLGMKMGEYLIETEGYVKMIELVIEAFERDCPFFFQAD